MALQLTLTDSIAAPPDRVFAVMTDMDSVSKWMPNLVKIETVTSGPYGPGTRWRETRKMFGKEATWEFEVKRAEPGRLLELYVDGKKGSSKRGEYRFTYYLEPSGPGTSVRMEGEIGGMGWLAELFGKMFLGHFKKACAKDLTAMKAFIEAGR